MAIEESFLQVGVKTEYLDTTKVTQTDGTEVHREAVVLTDPENLDLRARVSTTFASQVTSPPEGLSSFGEQLTGALTQQLLLNFAYNNNSDLLLLRANQSGSTSNANAMATVATGAAANSSGEIQSREVVRYVPGCGNRLRYTALFSTGVANSTQIAGLIDEANGFGFGYNGTEFGIIHRKNGSPEIRTLTISQGANDGTGDDDITITLDGDATTVTLTDFSGTASITANEIAAADFSSVGRGWSAASYGATVVFTSWDGAAHTGAYSLVDTDSTGAAGTFAQTVAGVAPTDDWIAQASWNGPEIFDGNGPTGETLDPTKGNIFQILVQWLGFGAVKFFIESQADGLLHLVHTLKVANTLTAPTLSIPHLPFSMIAENASNTSNLTISSASVGGFTDGKFELTGPRNAIKTSTAFGASTTEAPILMIQNKSVFASKKNRIKIKILDVSVAALVSSGNSSVAITIVTNPTLVGASFSDVGASTSVVATAVNTGNTVTTSGGRAVAELEVVSNSNASFVSADVNDLVLSAGDVLSIQAEPSANNTTVYVSTRWVEEF